jgi:hypothetical protein
MVPGRNYSRSFFSHGLVDVEVPLGPSLRRPPLHLLGSAVGCSHSIYRKILEPAIISLSVYCSRRGPMRMKISSVAMAMDTATIATVKDSLFIYPYQE